MHILWINDHANFTGGAERYIADTASLFTEQGHTNTLLYGVPGWTEPKFTSLFQHAFPLVSLARQLEEIKPDLIYIHRLASLQSLKIIIKSGIPAVRFFHDHKLFCLREHKYKTIGWETCRKPIGIRCYSCLGFINKSPKFHKIQFRSLAAFKHEHKINKKLTHIVLGSDYMKQHLEDHGFSNKKMSVIPLFTHASKHSPLSAKKRKNLLFVGQIVRGKGLDILLKALQDKSIPVKLNICGSGKQEEEYKQMCRDLGITSKVNWLGKVDHSSLERYYRSAECLIMPSRVPETFGLTGLEAMSVGTPVIATDVGGIGQWLIHNHNGLMVSPNDVETLRAAIKQIISQPEKIEEFGNNGYKDFQKKFLPEYHADKLAALFQNIVKGADHVR